jgi:hypothetical protein
MAACGRPYLRLRRRRRRSHQPGTDQRQHAALLLGRRRRRLLPRAGASLLQAWAAKDPGLDQLDQAPKSIILADEQSFL